ncbi:Sigma54 specific transcriptional regulator, Fis family [Syntrophobacter sp. SbD1]|nr:Sigma54 specific transcriptional regulator, Fis family [Syntrophobacter sp. SbD1]
MTVVTLENLVTGQNNLQNILDNMMEGIIAHDLERRIFFFNRAAEKITGYSREDVVGRDCHLVFGSPFCGSKCSFCDQPPGSLGHHAYTINISTRSGELRQVEMSVTGMYDEGGAFVGVLAAFRDITEMINLQIRLGELASFSGIVGRDHKMLDLYEQIRNLAAADYPVHITGETGTGKELVAAAIHNESARADGPFVPVNCGALPEGLLESELFGHVKGAFSGAIRDKKGRFELADGGTLFLDEVSELPKHMQVKLLRALQEGKFERVGAEKTICVNARIISATNKNLRRETEQQNFREDLYYRLSVVPISIPPLRERRNDIPLLAFHFLKQAVGQGHKATEVSEEALSLMMDYYWPGNVRELQNAIHYGLVKSRTGKIEVEHLPIEIRQMTGTTLKPGPKPLLTLESIESAIRMAGGNRSKAAKLLGVGRATLYRSLDKKSK